MAPAVAQNTPNNLILSRFLGYIADLARRPFSPAIIPLLYLIAPALVITYSVTASYYDFVFASVRGQMADDSTEIYDFIVGE